MALDIDTMLPAMLQAAKGPLENCWATARPAAEREFRTILQAIDQIGKDRLTQTITPEDAKDQLQIVTLAAKAAMDTEIGLAEVATESAINNALGAVSGVVNGFLGFALI